MPINNFKTLPPRCPLDFYQNSIRQSQKDIVSAEQARVKNYGSGHAFTQSTASVHQEANTIRFNAGSVFDAYSPSIQFISKTTIFQADSHHTHAYLNQTSSFNYWLRSENLIVQMTNNLYTYATKQNYSITADRLEESSNNTSYSDYFLLQVGQRSAVPLYKTPLKGVYGDFDISVANNFRLQTFIGGINLTSQLNTIVDSRQSVLVDSLIDFRSVAQRELYLRGALSFTLTGTEGVVGAETNLSLTSRGATFLRGSVVFINGGGRAPVNLDRATSLSRSQLISALKTNKSSTANSAGGGSTPQRSYLPIKDVQPYKKESATPNTQSVSDGIVEYPT